jgi:hypothetical protein
LKATTYFWRWHQPLARIRHIQALWESHAIDQWVPCARRRHQNWTVLQCIPRGISRTAEHTTIEYCSFLQFADVLRGVSGGDSCAGVDSSAYTWLALATTTFRRRANRIGVRCVSEATVEPVSRGTVDVKAALAWTTRTLRLLDPVVAIRERHV